MKTPKHKALNKVKKIDHGFRKLSHKESNEVTRTLNDNFTKNLTRKFKFNPKTGEHERTNEIDHKY